jgi:hypothetical protein
MTIYGSNVISLSLRLKSKNVNGDGLGILCENHQKIFVEKCFIGNHKAKENLEDQKQPGATPSQRSWTKRTAHGQKLKKQLRIDNATEFYQRPYTPRWSYRTPSSSSILFNFPIINLDLKFSSIPIRLLANCSW